MKSTTIMIKERISVDLALRDSVGIFFDYLESIPQKEITVDFSNIKSISRSFSHEYTIQNILKK